MPLSLFIDTAISWHGALDNGERSRMVKMSSGSTFNAMGTLILGPFVIYGWERSNIYNVFTHWLGPNSAMDRMAFMKYHGRIRHNTAWLCIHYVYVSHQEYKFLIPRNGRHELLWHIRLVIYRMSHNGCTCLCFSLPWLYDKLLMDSYNPLHIFFRVAFVAWLCSNRIN